MKQAGQNTSKVNTRLMAPSIQNHRLLFSVRCQDSERAEFRDKVDTPAMLASVQLGDSAGLILPNLLAEQRGGKTTAWKTGERIATPSPLEMRARRGPVRPPTAPAAARKAARGQVHSANRRGGRPPGRGARRSTARRRRLSAVHGSLGRLPACLAEQTESRGGGAPIFIPRDFAEVRSSLFRFALHRENPPTPSRCARIIPCPF